MGNTARIAAALAAALVAAACGEIENPDLATGALQGRILNGRPGGWVYAFGLPASKTLVDAAGRFELAALPEGAVTLVVVDGADPIDGTRRAGTVPAEVEGAERRELPDLDAASLPLAGRVFAYARPLGGARVVAPRFTVVGTDQVEVGPGPTGLAALAPLPPGTFELAASMDGFAGAWMVLAVPSATVIQEVPLSVDLESETPGCTATGGCVNGLVCDLSDGECEECVADADCAARGADAVCVEHECTVEGTSSGTGLLCARCAVDADCQAGGVCALDGENGSCTPTCSLDGECPAGFACVTSGGRSVCAPPLGCDEHRERFGAPCFDDSTCGAALAGGTCEGDDAAADPPIPGYCTGPCLQATPGACDAVAGYACSAGPTTAGVCIRQP